MYFYFPPRIEVRCIQCRCSGKVVPFLNINHWSNDWCRNFFCSRQSTSAISKEPMSFRSYRNCPFITRLVYLFNKKTNQIKKLILILLPEKNQKQIISKSCWRLGDVGVHESALKPGAHDVETWTSASHGGYARAWPTARWFMSLWVRPIYHDLAVFSSTCGIVACIWKCLPVMRVLSAILERLATKFCFISIVAFNREPDSQVITAFDAVITWSS
jgi:hypothetical protein